MTDKPTFNREQPYLYFKFRPPEDASKLIAKADLAKFASLRLHLREGVGDINTDAVLINIPSEPERRIEMKTIFEL